MTIRMLTVSAVGLLLASCVNVERAERPSAWPSSVPIRTVSDVAGTYRDAAEHTRRDDLNSLWYCFTQSRRIVPPRGAVVRLASPNDEFSATLLDARGIVLDRHLVRRFRLAFGTLSLPSASGVTADGFGSGVGTAPCTLSRTSDGGLVGQLRCTSAGLLFNLIPAVGTGTNWVYWPRTP